MHYLTTWTDRGENFKLAISTKFTYICQVKPTLVLQKQKQTNKQTNKQTAITNKSKIKLFSRILLESLKNGFLNLNFYKTTWNVACPCEAKFK